jgi:glutathione S-transferase
LTRPKIAARPRPRNSARSNPIGKIPTLVFNDGRMLSESGAILYLLARDTALFPAETWDQANVLRWMRSKGLSITRAVSVKQD